MTYVSGATSGLASCDTGRGQSVRDGMKGESGEPAFYHLLLLCDKTQTWQQLGFVQLHRGASTGVTGLCDRNMLCSCVSKY